MKLNRPITKHQRARLFAWTLAMLMWMASLAMGVAFTPRNERQRAERMSLQYLSWRVKMLLISRAIDFLPGRFRRGHNRRIKRQSGHTRAVVGARICALLKLKHGDVLDCIRALIDVLLNLDTHAKRIARRMKRGLTRRMPYRRVRVSDVDVCVLAIQAAFAFDSS